MDKLEIKPCPFCGGKAKPSVRYMHRKEYRPSEQRQAKKYCVQVICNKCHSRGRPISFYNTIYYLCDIPYLEKKKSIEPFLTIAIEEWNRRTEK